MNPDHVLSSKTIKRRDSTAPTSTGTGTNLGQQPDLHPILARVYGGRDIASVGELDLRLNKLAKPELLLGIDTATELLAEAVMANARIVIVGDFDADGATAATVAVLGLRQMGCSEVAYLVPNRFDYGYGLTPEIVELAAATEPDLIITVDNGISSIEGVKAAVEYGVSVLITDHHLPGEQLPAADAIVNPNQPGDTFPSKNLSGVGVMFYVLLALRAHLDKAGWFDEQGIAKPNLGDYLDLVALGTVADVVPLDYNNRILVDQGLKRIRARRCRPGIIALLESGRRSPEEIFATDLGFTVAPRLNAAGRLDDMSVGIECLLAETLELAAPLAQTLEQLNIERRKIETGMQEEAEATLAMLTEQSQSRQLPSGLCIFDKSWHHGVVGLVASRIKDKFDRPVVAFAPASDTELKGSARSVPGLHIRDLLERIATENDGLIQRFGGHAMAAGLSLIPDNLQRFEAAWTATVSDCLDGSYTPGVVVTDGALEHVDFSIDTADTLRRAGPWGQGFPEPRFDGVFSVVDARLVGEIHVKLTLRPQGSDRDCEAIAFRFGDRIDAILASEQLQVVYRLAVNNYRGKRTVQLVVEHLQLAA